MLMLEADASLSGAPELELPHPAAAISTAAAIDANPRPDGVFISLSFGSPAGPPDLSGPAVEDLWLGGRPLRHLCDRLAHLLARPAEQLFGHVQRRLHAVHPLPPLGDPQHAPAKQLLMDVPVECRGGRDGPCR